MHNDVDDNKVYDIAILGGGLAGLTLAKQVLDKRPETTIAILEKETFPVPDAAHKVGESTVEIGAHYLGEIIGLKKHLVDQQLPKFGLRFFLKEPGQTLAEGTEIGGSDFFPAPSYQCDRGRLENHLARVVADMGANLISGSTIRQVDFPDQEASTPESPAPYNIGYQHEKQDHALQARWLIDATGRMSFLKRKLDLDEPVEHNVNAVWFRFASQIQVDQWCDDPGWKSLTGKIPRRWLSTNHMMGAGYWVWIIPLATGSTSVGIVSDPRLHPLTEMNSFEKAIAWIERNEPICHAQLARHADKVQDFLAIKKLARNCRQVFSRDRWAITGVAGVFLDPFYSPGIDYIGIGNMMIAKLIEEDFAGRSIEQLAPTYQSIFMTLFQNNLLTYQDQYPLFGNPRIMSLKIVWDYALYWSFPALLFFHHKLTDPIFIQSLWKGIEELRAMNLRMQQFFRDWHESEAYPHVDAAFIDQKQVELLLQLNAELDEKLDDAALKTRFERNVNIIRDLMRETMDRVGVLTTDGENGFAQEPRPEPQLSKIFEALHL
ncbi:MAG: halogenase [Planctomyces sp.]|nr:halogenase [Planctomyces sp.]